MCSNDGTFFVKYHIAMKRLLIILIGAALTMTALSPRAAATEQSGKPEKTAVQTKESGKTIVLENTGENKIQVIKIIRDYLGIGLKEAHELVSSTPSVIKKNVSAKEAGELAKKLQDVGATVEIK